MKNNLKTWQGTTVVMGIDWGDSGKGRLIDDLSGRADIIARYNGGSNTGHTVNNQYGKFALHIIPSGIFNKNAICVVGRNVAVDVESLIWELGQLDKAKVPYNNLIIDEQASLTMPWHKMRDGIREKFRTNKVGTTGKGVGPTYADRTERVGLLVVDLISKDLKQKIVSEVKIQNTFFNLKINADKVHNDYKKYAARISKFIGNTSPIVQKAVNSGKNVLFEGAQGYFLDIDAGTYPFVTSSNPGVVGVWRSFDIHPSEIKEVIGITKAYTTRVGEGPMPTKIEGNVAKKIIEVGREVGTTTGRVRSPGWLDLVLVKVAAKSNKLTGLAITKLDVLSGQKTIKLCIKYKQGSKEVQYLPHDSQNLAKIKPVYLEFKGWKEDITAVRSFALLPKNAQIYLKAIEKFTGVPIKFISVGPKRGQVIYR